MVGLINASQLTNVRYTRSAPLTFVLHGVKCYRNKERKKERKDFDRLRIAKRLLAYSRFTVDSRATTD